MPYLIPNYIAATNIKTSIIKYPWDDTRVFLDFKHQDNDSLITKLNNVSLNGNTTLGIGICEWIVWRYYYLSDDSTPFQIIESAWCANIKREYGIYTELDRHEYIGPIRGPLWCAVTWLLPLIYFPDEHDWRASIDFLICLAIHVSPKPEIFEEWLEVVTNRLINMHPAPEDDPFQDLFNNDHEEERRGSLVAREVLDPSFDYRPDQAPQLLDRFLRNVDYKNNPFLRSPEELIEAGVEHPYRVLP